MDNGEVKSFPWVDEWDENVRKIVRTELDGMEERVTTAVTANVNQTINTRMDQQRDSIAKVDAGQLYIIRRLDVQDDDVREIGSTLTALSTQIGRIEGRQLGIDQTESKYESKAQADRDRLVSVAKVTAGVGGGGGLLGLLARWIATHWHGWWH